MREIAEKLVRAEQEMAAHKGRFLVFGLFLREQAPDVWDLVVAAPWVVENKSASLQYISDKISSALQPDELVKLSRIVLVEPDNPSVAALHQAIKVEHGISEIKDCHFSGMEIRHAYLITSQRAQDPAAR